MLWASIPKRHVLTAALALASLYLLALSRASETARAVSTADTQGQDAQSDMIRLHPRWKRALAYVPVGLTAWLHAAEGFVLLVAVAGVDLLFARDRSPRTLATVAVVFGCSLVPLVVTNVLISGDPFTVPRMLAPYDAASDGVRFVGGGGSGGTAGEAASDSVLAPVVTAVSGVLTAVAAPVLPMLRRGFVFIGMLETGLTTAFAEPSKVYHMLLRSGYVGTDGSGATGLAINLAFLEALPVAGTLVAAPVVAVRRYRTDGGSPLRTIRAHLATPAGTADAFALVYACLLALLYLPRFPLHAMLTARYVHSLFPLAIYAVARLPAVRAALTEAGRPLVFAFCGGVLIGGQLTALAVALTGFGVDEAMQGYALLALTLAAILGSWSLVATWRSRYARPGAALLGVAGATTTNLVGVIAFDYFGRAFLLPVIPL
jgi:hypothetical protein